MTKLILLALAGMLAGCGAAQSRPDPADPRVAERVFAYRSAFENYRAFVEQPAASWREANEAVGAAGGHQAHVSAQERK